MPDPIILLVSHDPDLVGAARREVETLGGSTFRVVATIEEADAEVAVDDLAAVLVHVTGGVNYLHVAQLIRRVSSRSSPVPVLVLSRDPYDVEQALVLFEIGVTDYLSLPEHLDRLAAILGPMTGGLKPQAPATVTARAVPDRRVPLKELLSSLFG